MVQDSTSRADKDLAPVAQLLGLFLDRDTPIDSGAGVLHGIVSDISEDSRNLDCKLPRWTQNDSLSASGTNKAMLAQVLSDWQCESKCLS